MNNNTIRELIALEIKNDEMIMNKAEEFKKTIKDFDGKVFNIRLEKALQANTGLSIDIKRKQYNTKVFELSVWLKDRSIQNVYMSYNSVYIGNFWNKDFVNESNRINADIIIAEFDQWMEERKKANIEKLAQLDQLEDLQKERKEIMETIEKYNKKLNSSIDAYAELSINVRY